MHIFKYLLTILFVMTYTLSAQEQKDAPRVSEKKQVTYYLATYYHFYEADDISDVRKIMTEDFLPAAAAVDWEVQVYYPLMTGSDYDMMVLFHLPDGLATLEWGPAPKDVAFS
jgi:hypothetical protein